MAEEKTRWSDLQQAALGAQRQAYAPYSNYPVGAAVLGDDGQIYTGCNVENASYGLTVCAERNAIAAAIASGVRTIAAVMVCSDGETAATPCGACRQVIAEFTTGCPIVCLSSEGDRIETSVAELLPRAFAPRVFQA